MADHQYITNPSAQQGAPMDRKGPVRPAGIEADTDLAGPGEDRRNEGPETIPEHSLPPSGLVPNTRPLPAGSTGKSMGETIGR